MLLPLDEDMREVDRCCSAGSLQLSGSWRFFVGRAASERVGSEGRLSVVTVDGLAPPALPLPEATGGRGPAVLAFGSVEDARMRSEEAMFPASASWMFLRRSCPG
jgi:hypothetical protein